MTRNIVSPPDKYPWQKLFKSPQALIFFWSPPFQNLGLKVIPSSGKGEGWYCDILYNIPCILMGLVLYSLFFKLTWKTIYSTTAGFLNLLFFSFLVQGFCWFEGSDIMSFLSWNKETKNYTKETFWVYMGSRLRIGCQFFQPKFVSNHVSKCRNS